MSNKPARRLIDTSKVVVMPSVENLMADATSIIEMELVKFKTKVRQGKSLEQAEGRLLNGYIKSLCELMREQRERDKDADLSKLSTEELIELLRASNDKDKTAAEVAQGKNEQSNS